MPMMPLSGVRSSWLTIDTNSFFIRSTARRSVMSRMLAVYRRSSPFIQAEIENSSGTSVWSLRSPKTSTVRPTSSAVLG